MSTDRPTIRVVHSHPTWLQQTQTWIFTQVTSLPAEIESHVYCQRTTNLDQFPVSNLYCLAHSKPLTYRINRACQKLGISFRLDPLAKYIEQTQASVVHSHFGHIGASDRRQVARTAASHVVTFYGFDVVMLPRQRPKLVGEYCRMFRSADLILCEGAHMAGAIAELGCPPEKIRVQHLGVDLNKIPYEPRHWDGKSPLKLLIAASFREKKGIPDAIRAIGKLARNCDLQLTIVGDAGKSAGDQREKACIQAEIQKSRLNGRVHMLGYQSHSRLQEIARDHHVFVSTSVTAENGDCEGGAPVSLVEMAASGMPIVSTRHCDIPEVVKHGITGWLAPERDVPEILGCLERIAGMGSWSDMLLRGRQHVEANYDLEKQGLRLAKLYRELLLGKS